MKTELLIPSDIQFISVVEQWLLGFLNLELEHFKGRPQIIQRLRLALAEGYSNAVRHAHKGKPSLPVKLRLEVVQDLILLEIWDQGDGYDIQQYSAPKPEDRQEGGYGWMILSRLVDDVRYETDLNGGSNCLRLLTRLTPELGKSDSEAKV